MSKQTFYSQCVLQKKSIDGLLQRVSYIPSKFAILNNIVKLKEEDGTWTDGWKVTTTGSKISEDLLPDSYSMIKSHRNATGDSLKKA